MVERLSEQFDYMNDPGYGSLRHAEHHRALVRAMPRVSQRSGGHCSPESLRGDEVAAIRAAGKAGVSAMQIARDFALPTPLIHDLLAGRAWPLEG